MAGKLEAYRNKRDFAVTSEPDGAAEAVAGPRLRFVVQKHDATRLHYDFRLEHEGVLKSWAVTRGPSLDPADKRLAVEVEDHPLDYGDFEGGIPKGQYGGGTVMLWDRGLWAPEPGTTIEEGLAKGDLKFVLEGERLHGSWVLVRMAHDRAAKPGKPGRTNWLLIKHKDGEARTGGGEAFLAGNAVSIASGRDMAAIAAGAAPGPTRFITAGADAPKRAPAKRVWNSNKGDPEASAEAVAETAVHPAPKPRRPSKKKTAVPGSAVSASPPRFIPPQFARSVDRPPSGPGWVHEIKFDGYRLQLRTAGGTATAVTRSGLDWTARFPEIAAAAALLPDGLIDGEAVALDADGAPDFAGLQQALSDGRSGGLVFFAFDALFAGGADLRALPLSERKTRLRAVLDAPGRDDGGRLRFVEHFEDGGEAVLSSACSMHLEGVVSKRLDSPYVSGRGETWTKAKCRGGQEVIVAGWTGDAAKPFRSLIAAVRRERRLVHVGRVGTG